MIILGVSDGPCGGAAVVRDDRVVSVVSQPRLEGEHQTLAFPWDAMDAALDLAGVSRADVDLVGVAGRITPLFFLRRRPALQRWLDAPFSPTQDLQVFWQAVLRYSGAAAYDADVAAEWLDARFKERGFGHARLATVGVHRALAAGAYRLQPQDDALVMTLHPMGDGVALAVHDGCAGQLDEIFRQAGFSALHMHFQRAVAAMGLRPWTDVHLIDDLAGQGTPDSTLVRMLSRHLATQGPSLARSVYPRPSMTSDEAYARIGLLSQADAAASILENYVETVTDLVRVHLRRLGRVPRRLILAGDVFEYARVATAVAELPEVTSLSVIPGAGRAALPVGAAAAMAGLSPSWAEIQLGQAIDSGVVTSALARAELSSVRRANLIDLLCAGEALVRFRGRDSPDPIGQGERCVMVRADDSAAIERVRQALGRHRAEVPRCLMIPTANEEPLDVFSVAPEAVASGALAPRMTETFRMQYPGVVAADGRARLHRVDSSRQPGLFQVLRGLLRNSGCGAVAAFPLAEADGPLIQEPGHVIEMWRRGGFAALQLGAHYILRDG